MHDPMPHSLDPLHLAQRALQVGILIAAGSCLELVLDSHRVVIGEQADLQRAGAGVDDEDSQCGQTQSTMSGASWPWSRVYWRSRGPSSSLRLRPGPAPATQPRTPTHP